MSIAARAGQSILAIALALGASAPLHAQTPDLSHTLKFAIGDTYFLDGDSITIDSIQGPTDAIEPGHAYLVTGTYKLTSHPDALLSSNVTSDHNSVPREHVDGRQRPSTTIHQGEGRFSVYLNMDTNGFPHISFYPSEGGNSFAGVYFGMGDSLMKPRHHDGVTPVGTDSITHH
jgi:hypothetical protein